MTNHLYFMAEFFQHSYATAIKESYVIGQTARILENLYLQTICILRTHSSLLWSDIVTLTNSFHFGLPDMLVRRVVPIECRLVPNTWMTMVMIGYLDDTLLMQHFATYNFVLQTIVRDGQWGHTYNVTRRNSHGAATSG